MEITAFLRTLFPSLPGAGGIRRSTRQPIESGLKDFVEGGGIPGLSAAFITAEGAEYFSRGIDPENPGAPLTEVTQFQVASISKLLTTTVLADLVREGGLSLDDPAEKYLPANVRLPSRNGKVITLRTLATHTSGLPAAGRGDAERAKSVKLGWDYELQVIAAQKLPTDPGARFNYSNMGMSLLGHILEIRSKTPYEQLVARRVLLPLGMDNTWITRPAGSASPIHDFDIGIYSPAGGYSSNARDLAKFAAGALGKAPAPLLGSLNLTFTPQGRDDGGRFLHLGWHEEGQPSLLSHTGLQHAYLGIDLERKVGLVLLCTAQTAQINGLGLAALQVLGGGKAEFPRPRPVIRLSPGTLEKYTGAYRQGEKGGTIAVTSDPDRDILLLSFDGGTNYPMWAQTQSLFYCREWKCDMQFPDPVDGKAPSAAIFMDSWSGEYARTDSGGKRVIP